VFAPLWAERADFFNSKPWRSLWAVTPHERLRLKVMLDASMAYAYGLTFEDYQWLLLETDYPASFLSVKKNTKRLDQKRFWRIDKALDPELRHTVLAQVAFCNLLNLGPDEFFGQNAGEGWLIPQELCLGDFGLGHDDRAGMPLPVASRLGPRFAEWQLDEDVTRSWEECAAHAELVDRIAPRLTKPNDIGANSLSAAEDPTVYRQGCLF
jgi:hypothetical protein